MCAKYTIVGQILDSSGYASHTRQLFNALAKENDVKLSTGLTPTWLRVVYDKELEAIKKVDDYERTKIIVTHPVFWRVNATNKRNWAYCVWEGSNVPKHFIEEMLNPEIEKIIVPSIHTQTAIANTCDGDMTIMDKVYCIPHGVDHSIFKPLNHSKDKFTFLCNKGFRNLQDRGGTQYFLEAYIKEFTNKEDVRAIIKINPAYGVPDIMKMIKEMGGDRTDLPEIVVDTANYPYNQLVNLYNECDVFVATTRCEGFGLPMIEAMACGVPVITTKFGGQTDFVNEDNGFLIDGKLEEIKHEIQYENNKWFTPDVLEIRRALRECYLRPEYVKQKGLLSLEASKSYSWDKTAKFMQV
jgi:glycosyltransferase involved in cell wall biosynthesis